jgi:hypothetical protein
MKIRLLILILLYPIISFAQLYKAQQGSVKFTSNAPLELIQAQSAKISGLLKTTDKSFAFSIPMSSFEGFNSSLQRTHFNENYVESARYPNATFEGKIIEDIDFGTPGTYEIRGKGKFSVHGVELVRIIKCQMIILNDKITITSKFSVMLADHNIKIPSVVSKKITEEIEVEIHITMIPKK